ncbi:MAG: potassium-transporting ATPase subunit F [Intrasporangium sp.]
MVVNVVLMALGLAVLVYLVYVLLHPDRF